MTGTADTEAAEFHQIYKLDVTRRSRRTSRCMRKDHRRPRLQERARQVPRGRRRRSRTATSAASRCWSARSRVEKSEVVATLLRKKGIPHNVLNAKQHEREAYDRRAGGPQGRGHDRDQHGRPRHRHHPRRQRRVHGARRGRSRERRQARARAGRPRSRPRYEEAFARVQGPVRRREAGGARRRRPAHPRHRAPRVAPHRQPAARPRRPPGRPGLRRGSTCRWRTT